MPRWNGFKTKGRTCFKKEDVTSWANSSLLGLGRWGLSANLSRTHGSPEKGRLMGGGEAQKGGSGERGMGGWRVNTDRMLTICVGKKSGEAS